MNESIDRLINEIVTIMGGDIECIWLYGSIVLNDFRLGWSDIDFIALTRKPITNEQAEKMLLLRQALSAKEPDNLYYRSFEGIIANRDEFLLKKFSRLVYWGTSGQRITDNYQMDCFSMFELAKYGKCVFGNDDRTIFPLPRREEIIKAVQNHYTIIRKYGQETGDSLYSCGWLFDIARCLYTLKYNDIIGKTQAAVWGLESHLFSNEDALIKAIEIRQNPMQYKENESTKRWLCGLGPTVQAYADVLETELKEIESI